MSYEQKYKDALERMKSWVRGEHPECFTEAQKAAEFIFPELAESEDERMRKELLDYLHTRQVVEGLTDTKVKMDWVTWLEKQGEKANPYSGISFEYNGHTWGMCARDNGVDILLDKQLFTHLEKQGEQKDPCEDCSHPKLNCGNFPRIEKRVFDSDKSIFECIKTEHQQNPTDKVKPKFKVGDWIVDNRTGVVHYIAKIKGTVDGCYYVLGYDKGLLHVDNESDYHLWTIKDAKDGDVLVDVCGNIGIFEKGCEINWHTYCYLGFDGRFIPRCGSHGSICYPATKEQQDYLFKKMSEDGYIWDDHAKMLICSINIESK